MYKLNFQNDDIKLKALFIDAKYMNKESNLALSTEKFNKYTGELWDFASTIEPFPMKDINVALGELATLYQRLKG